MVVLTPDGRREVDVRSSAQASRVAAHWNALDTYLRTGDSAALRRFANKRIGGLALAFQNHGSAVPSLLAPTRPGQRVWRVVYAVAPVSCTDVEVADLHRRWRIQVLAKCVFKRGTREPLTSAGSISDRHLIRIWLDTFCRSAAAADAPTCAVWPAPSRRRDRRSRQSSRGSSYAGFACFMAFSSSSKSTMEAVAY
jgi:hypothetical protein